MNKIFCLGAAKLGMPDYGYSLNYNKLTDSKSFILDALDAGVNCIDTSPRYGNSEKIIGNALRHSKNKPLISTKIDGIRHNDKMSIFDMEKSIQASIKKLGVEFIDICYLHQNEIEILSDKYVHDGINYLKDKKLLKYIGASVYSKEELHYVISSEIFDWVQIPINILDSSFYQSILSSGSKIKVAARSIYLQGILFQRNAILSDIKSNKDLQKNLKIIEEYCKVSGLNLIELTMSYLTSLDKLDAIIVGTTSIDNLKKNIDGMRHNLSHKMITDITDLSKKEKPWTNPRNWLEK